MFRRRTVDLNCRRASPAHFPIFIRPLPLAVVTRVKGSTCIMRYEHQRLSATSKPDIRMAGGAWTG